MHERRGGGCALRLCISCLVTEIHVEEREQDEQVPGVVELSLPLPEKNKNKKSRICSRGQQH